MNIIINWDSSVNSAPAGFKTTVNYVVGLFDSLFTNTLSVTIGVGWGEVAGHTLPSGYLGESYWNYSSGYSYAQIRSALLGNPTSATQAAAYATLPNADPTGGKTFNLTLAEAEALGLASGGGSVGSVGFSSTVSWDFTPGTTPSSSSYDFIGVVEHELSEVLGRDSFIGNALSPMDLFRYSAPGVRDLTPTPPSPYTVAYFSIDAGTTDLANWNPKSSGGDLGDWAAAAGSDAFLAVSYSGRQNYLTTTDVTLMNLLGWATSSQPNEVANGVTALSQTVSSGGTEIVLSGGGALNVTVLSGGEQIVSSGGYASATVVSAGGLLLDSGQTYAARLSGGSEELAAGGGAAATKVFSGGLLQVDSGGATVSATIASGGGEVVSGGGSDSQATVQAGGAQTLFGTASATVVAGLQTVSSGGTAVGDLISSGGEDLVVAGGAASATTVNAGGLELVSGGQSTAASVSGPGALQTIAAGGAANGATIGSGGAQLVQSGGSASATTVNSGGVETVQSGGAAYGAVVASGGGEIVSGGGSDSQATIQAGGAQTLSGTASATVVAGLQTVSSGGTAVADLINSGGEDLILAGGAASATTVNAGGLELVSGGQSTAASVSGPGALQTIAAGGAANGATIGSGGAQLVQSGGSASAATVNSGGVETVQSGGAAYGAVVASGGVLTVMAGASAGGSLDLSGKLAGGGTLALRDGTSTFHSGAILAVARISQSGASVVDVSAPSLIFGGAWTQAAGTILVDGGDILHLTGTGDTFSGVLTGSGVVAFNAGTDRLDGATLSAGCVNVTPTAVVTLAGALNLTTTLSVTNPGLMIDSGGASLSGGGRVVLTNLTTNRITGTDASATLTNINDRIFGAGQLGGGTMTLVNQTAGVITATSATNALVIDTGGNTITNAGLICCAAAGGLTIAGAIANTGHLSVRAGTLRVAGAVTGSGSVTILGGVAQFAAGVGQTVNFAGTSGVLELAQSQSYGGVILNFSTTGGTALDLDDIAFVSGVTQASYSGTTKSGLLTVTDRTHTAKIRFNGDYTASTFTLASDGHGGTTVVDPTTTVLAHPFIQAMAAFSGAAASAPLIAAPSHARPDAVLFTPRRGATA